MVIDNSAFPPILHDEAERTAFLRRIEAAPTRLRATCTLAGASSVVIARWREAGLADPQASLTDMKVQPVPPTYVYATSAVDAYRHYGKGCPAAELKLDDCHFRAPAKVTGQPLLSTGNDLACPDIIRAV